MLLQQVQKVGRKTDISPAVLLRILRTVHSCQVEYEVRFGAVFIQLLRRPADIVFIDLVDPDTRSRLVFSVPYVFQIFRKVPADKTSCARNQYFHICSFRHTVLFTIPT